MKANASNAVQHKCHAIRKGRCALVHQGKILLMAWLMLLLLLCLAVSIVTGLLFNPANAQVIEQTPASTVTRHAVPSDIVSLTQEERQWLTAHDARIRIGITVIPPQILADGATYKGLSIDYIHLLERKLGCRFKLVPYMTWNEVIQAAKARDIDMIFAAQQTTERKEYLLFTEPYIELPNIIVVRKDRAGGAKLSEMQGWSVATAEGSAVQEYLKEQFPDLELRPVAVESAGLQMVSLGEADAMVVEISRASYYIEKEGILNLRVAGDAGLLYRLRFAVRKDWPELRVILDRGLASIREDERREIARQWIIVGTQSLFESGVFWIWLLGLSGVVGIILVGSFTWNRVLHRVVRQRTEQLQLELAERQRTEQVLRMSEDRFRLAQAIGRVGNWECDLRSMQVRLSDEAKRIYGLDPTRYEFALHEIESVIPERMRVHQAMIDLIEDGKPYNIEFEIQPHDQKDSRIIMSLAELQRDEYGKPLKVVAVVQDITERKLAEMALRESKEKFAAAFHATPGLIAITRVADGTILDVNDAYSQMLGFTREESVGKKTSSLSIWVNPEDRKIFVKQLQKFGKISNFETKLRRKDGEVIDVLVFARAISIQGESCILLVAYDISERKHAEIALQHERALLARITETSPIGITMVNRQGVVIFANSQAVNLLGLSKDEITQRAYNAPQWRITDFSGGSLSEEELPFRQVMTTRHPVFDVRHAIEWPDGRRIHLSINGAPLLDDAGEIESVVFALEDVTERTRFEQALRDSELKYREIFDNASDAMYLLEVTEDNRFLTIDVNPALLQLTGIPVEKIIGRFVDESSPPEAGWAVIELYRHCVESEAMVTDESEHDFPSGRRTFLSSFVPLRDASGRIHRIIAISRDITERKQAEEMIRGLNQELEQRVVDRTAQLGQVNKELEAFSYSVSHDLRTPLRAIDGFTHILLEEHADKLDDEGKRLLKVVCDNTRHMGQLIDDMLQFSRTGRAELTYAEIDMERLARDAVSEILSAAPNDKLQIKIDHIPVAKGDRAMIRQVFLNLISNAIKFSRTREVPTIRIDATVEVGEAVYCVADNGVGFDMNYVNKLFGVFQRLHSMSEFEGTGIGLAIVKSIINRHGGRVWAEGKVDKGAAFYFSLPRGGIN